MYDARLLLSKEETQLKFPLPHSPLLVRFFPVLGRSSASFSQNPTDPERAGGQKELDISLNVACVQNFKEHLF